MSALSRKFYERLASRFKEQKPSVHAQSYEMWVDMVFASASAIAEGNPAFDRGRFLKACGLDPISAAVEAGWQAG